MAGADGRDRVNRLHQESVGLGRGPVRERFKEKRREPGAGIEALADDVMMTVLDPAFLRTKSREMPLDDVGEVVPAMDDERLDFDRFYAREVFESALEAFREESVERESPEARIVDLYYRRGLTQEEIAKQMGLTVPSTNTRLDRGRKRLRKHFLAMLATVARNEEEILDEAKISFAILPRRRRPDAR